MEASPKIVWLICHLDKWIGTVIIDDVYDDYDDFMVSKASLVLNMRMLDMLKQTQCQRLPEMLTAHC